MELALFIRRTLSRFAVACLLTALIGCTEQPSGSPPPAKDSKKVEIPVSPTGKSEATPTPSERLASEKEKKPEDSSSTSATEKNEEVQPSQDAKDASIQEFLTPSQPNATFSNPNTNPSNQETKEGKKEKKPGSPSPSSETLKGEQPDSKSEKDTAIGEFLAPSNTSAKPPVDVKENEKDKSDLDATENEDEKPMTDEEIAAESAARRKAALKEIIDKLGPPLVENADKLKKADPLYPVWIDKENKRVVLQGVICQTNAPLEMFAVLSGTKEHEAIVAVPTEAHLVHAALIVVGANPGKPVEFGPKPSDYKPATGTEIDITVKWKNDKGEVQSARAQEWIKNVKTGKEMTETWVFCGSGFWKDEQTGIEYYKAEGGDFICVSNFPSAMLDLPIESSQSNEALMFQADSDRIPPQNTPITLVLTPNLKPGSKSPQPQAGDKKAEHEQPESKK